MKVHWDRQQICKEIDIGTNYKELNSFRSQIQDTNNMQK
jgi:tRNA A37 N6-isopentenylltransferase MiaA